jgi:hypothetical protein
METKKDIYREIETINDELVSILDQKLEAMVETNPDMNYLKFIDNVHSDLLKDTSVNSAYSRLERLLFFYNHNN